MTKQNHHKLRQRSLSGGLSKSSTNCDTNGLLGRFRRSTTIEELLSLSLEEEKFSLTDVETNNDSQNDHVFKNDHEKQCSNPISMMTSVPDRLFRVPNDDESSSLSSGNEQLLGDDDYSLSSSDDEPKSNAEDDCLHIITGSGSCRDILASSLVASCSLYPSTSKGCFEQLMSTDNVVNDSPIETKAERDVQEREELVGGFKSDSTIGTSNLCLSFKEKRKMTPRQEMWNALTMIPNPLFCIWFVLSGRWIDSSVLEQVRTSQLDWLIRSTDPKTFDGGNNVSVGSFWESFGGVDEHGCLITDSVLGRIFAVPALPPLAVLAVAIGISLQAPFSFLYHWKYATQPNALTHWSRRMDQAMIHFASACVSFATSGNLKYFAFNCLYNADCCYKQLFDPVVKPKRNQTRLLISMILYTLPICRRGELVLFSELWLVQLITIWLFVAYPFGGWSHATFHLVSMVIPPLLMVSAMQLSSSQEQIITAAQCIVRSSG